MAETVSARWRQRVEQYGVVGPVAVAVAAGLVYYGVHEAFHVVFGYGFATDTVGSVALGAVAAAVALALGRNLRTILGAFVGLFVAHTLVMGHYGSLAIGTYGQSVSVAVVAAVVIFAVAGGFEA